MNPFEIKGQSLLTEIWKEIEVEPKYYRVGAYTLKQEHASTFTNEKAERVAQLIHEHATGGLADFMNAALGDILDVLYTRGLLVKLYAIVLEFHDATWGDRILRRIRMWWKRETMLGVVQKMTMQQNGQVFMDFFVLNFSSMPTSNDSSGTTTSPSTQAESGSSPSTIKSTP